VTLICPEGYIAVGGNSFFGTNDFCVMKYEAKAYNTDTGSIVADGGGESTAHWAGDPGQTRYVARSVPEGLPWVNISSSDGSKYNAKEACLDLNDGNPGTYDLISNPEWMTIATNAENQAENWSSGVVGTGTMARGHSDDEPGSNLEVINVSDPYDGTENSSEDGWEQRRTLVLSTGEEIWDLAGNVFQWVDWTLGGETFSTGPTNCVSEWREFDNLPACDLDPEKDLLPDGDYTSENGVGQFFGGGTGVALRGGRRTPASNPGAFALRLNYAPDFSGPNMGFRCVFRPQ
jgi:hypothetical protein